MSDRIYQKVTDQIIKQLESVDSKHTVHYTRVAELSVNDLYYRSMGYS